MAKPKPATKTPPPELDQLRAHVGNLERAIANDQGAIMAITIVSRLSGKPTTVLLVDQTHAREELAQLAGALLVSYNEAQTQLRQLEADGRGPRGARGKK